VAINRRLDRIFLDAGFFIARYNRRDELHQRARSFAAELVNAGATWTTDAVLLEVTASMAHQNFRVVAIGIWNQFHGGDARCISVDASAENLEDAMSLYGARPDKEWSQTDCLSFLVMERLGLTDALTADQHYEQAGFRALLR
jgi:predicted nucleic acid-binding protein